jgi:dTDP-4-dehydrorhamnose reductase
VTPRILPVMAADFKTTAPRPLFCALSNRKLVARGIEMPSWQSVIRRHLTARPAQSAVGVRETSCTR